MTTTSIDLQQFCAAERSRYQVDRPFVRKGFLCACDGSIAVRVPTVRTDDTPDSLPVEDKIAPSNPPPDDQWTPWPMDAVAVRGLVACERCGGTGYLNTVECPACRGETVQCPLCDEIKTCYHCKGSRYINTDKCPACDGCCDVEGDKAFRVGDGYIRADYYRKIRTLPKVRYYWPDPDKRRPCYFRFDGGEGAVMPIRVD